MCRRLADIHATGFQAFLLHFSVCVCVSAFLMDVCWQVMVQHVPVQKVVQREADPVSKR